MPEAARPNQDQAELWNSAAGRNWVEMQDKLDRIFAPIEAAITTAAFPGQGGKVLDIGCGSGATTLAMARLVGEAGRCLGVDISAPLIAAATRRAQAEGVETAGFETADAQTYRFPPAAFDAAISRFGIMFFDDPVAAFANIRAALKPGGKLVFAAWRSPAENPFMTAAARAAAPLLPELRPTDPDAPGQFAFARPERMKTILSGAGWREIHIEPLDAPAELSEPELAAYVDRMGPVGLALQGLDAPRRTEVAKAVRAGFQPFEQDGAVRFDMACWLASARA